MKTRWLFTVLGGLLAASSSLSAFEFTEENSCILLADGNTNPFVDSPDCALPENLEWCWCARSIFSNPLKGEATAFEMGIIQDRGDPGLANILVDVNDGTLDVSGVSAGDLLGTFIIKELIPIVNPPAFFDLSFEIRATAVNASTVDFEVVLQTVDPFTLNVLTYDPTDADHANGLLDTGRIVSRGAGAGFTVEWRYEFPPPAPAITPAIQPGDYTDPGFGTRPIVSLFGPGSALDGDYVLPTEGTSITAAILARRTREGPDSLNVDNPAEILPLGSDLCEIIDDPLADLDPCKEFEDVIPIFDELPNNPPVAVIVATSGVTGEVLDGTIDVDCGVGQAILRGTNSSDGDNGTQGLTYQWEVISGTEGGVELTSPNFKDTLARFLVEDVYEISLTVNDGQSEDNTDSTTVVLEAVPGLGPNEPPTASLTFQAPAVAVGELSAELQLAGGVTEMRVDVSTTSGPDGCPQEELAMWERISGPATVIIRDPLDEDLDLTFAETGEYEFKLTVDDFSPENNILEVVIDVLVTGTPGQLPGDVNQDGGVDISDPVAQLNFLFAGILLDACMLVPDSFPPALSETGVAISDWNGDGGVDISDPVSSLNFQFGGIGVPHVLGQTCTQIAGDCPELCR